VNRIKNRGVHYYYLSADEGQKAQNAGAFDGLGKFSLMPRAAAGVSRVNYFRLAGNKPAQKDRIFVIYVFYILRTKDALVIHSK